MNQFNDPYEKQFWGNTQKHMVNQYKDRYEMAGMVIGPDEELMIIRHPLDGLQEAFHSEATVESQTGLHIKIDDLRSGVRNLLLSKANGTTNDGNYLEAFEYTAGGDKPTSFARLTAAGVFTDASARDLKENIKDLTEHQIQKILTEARMYRFNYIKEPGVVYVGPMAEEFHRLTGWGYAESVSPKTLAGIALRLVQWVWNKVKGYEERIEALETQLALQQMPSEEEEPSEEE
jgi:hypothetical protein